MGEAKKRKLSAAANMVRARDFALAYVAAQNQFLKSIPEGTDKGELAAAAEGNWVRAFQCSDGVVLLLFEEEFKAGTTVEGPLRYTMSEFLQKHKAAASYDKDGN